MGRIFSFSSGTIWMWIRSCNRGQLIKYARKLDVNGFELTLSNEHELRCFKVSQENRKWLRSLDYVSIHAPFGLLTESMDDDNVRSQLDIISSLYEDINAKNVIIHPNQLPPSETLKKYNFKVSTENMPRRYGIGIVQMERVFSEHKRIGLCLDVSHAYQFSKNETRNLVNAFKKRITQIHLSGTYRNMDHLSLRQVSKNFLASLEPIKELDVPIVIEESIPLRSIKFLKEEIAFIKKYFEN